MGTALAVYGVLCLVVPIWLGTAIKKHRAVNGLEEDTRLQDLAQMHYLRTGECLNVVDEPVDPRRLSRAERIMGLD